MPHAIKLHNELGSKGLIVLLPEVQGAAADDLPPFMMRNFPDGKALVFAGGVPIAMSGSGIPQCALIGVDGTVMLQGYTGDMGKKTEKAIKDELDKLKTGWGNSPVARKARAALYGRLSPAEARAALASGDAGAEAGEVDKEIESWVRTHQKMIAFLESDGQWQRALDEANTFARGVKGVAEWEAKAKEILAAFDSAEGKREIDVDKKVATAVKKLETAKIKPGDAKALRAAFKGSEDTKAGARIARIADVLEKAEKLKRG